MGKKRKEIYIIERTPADPHDHVSKSIKYAKLFQVVKCHVLRLTKNNDFYELMLLLLGKNVITFT